MRDRRMFNLAQLVALAVLAGWLMAGCASSTAFVVSGESLDAAGRGFVAVGLAYNKGLDGKTVTVEQYREWASFARKFQQAYPSSVQLWKSSVAVNDAALTKKSEAIVISLVSELVKLGQVVGVQVMK